MVRNTYNKRSGDICESVVDMRGAGRFLA